MSRHQRINERTTLNYFELKGIAKLIEKWFDKQPNYVRLDALFLLMILKNVYFLLFSCFVGSISLLIFFMISKCQESHSMDIDHHVGPHYFVHCALNIPVNVIPVQVRRLHRWYTSASSWSLNHVFFLFSLKIFVNNKILIRTKKNVQKPTNI